MDAQITPRAEPERRRIGGTDIGILLGVNSFGQTPLDIYNRIVLQISSFKGNAYSDRGLKYEDHVRQEYLKQTGALLHPHPGVVVFGDNAFAASLDDIAARADTLFPVDYKTASIKGIRKWGPDGSDGIPENYEWQLRWYMRALEETLGIKSDHAELFAAFGVDVKDDLGNFTGEFAIEEYRAYFIPRDFEKEERAVAAGLKFHREHIVPRIPPEDPKASETARYAALITSPTEGNSMSLFARLNQSSSVTPPPPAAIVVNSTPVPAVAATDAALRSQVPDDDVAQVIPPDAAPMSAGFLDAPAPGENATKPPTVIAEDTTGAKKRGRPRKVPLDIKGTEVLTYTPPAEDPALEAAREKVTASMVANGFLSVMIYVDCMPNAPTMPLAGYVAGIVAKIEKAFEIEDIRCAPKKFKNQEGMVVDNPLAYGGWKGMLAACVKREPPPPGVYVVLGSNNELMAEVLSALEAQCAPGCFIRGVRG